MSGPGLYLESDVSVSQCECEKWVAEKAHLTCVKDFQTFKTSLNLIAGTFDVMATMSSPGVQLMLMERQDTAEMCPKEVEYFLFRFTWQCLHVSTNSLQRLGRCFGDTNQAAFTSFVHIGRRTAVLADLRPCLCLSVNTALV